MRVLLLGAGGMLGHALGRACPSPVTLTSYTHADLDITDPGKVEGALVGSRADVVINAAAYTSVDRAEQEAAPAFAANRDGPAIIAKIAKANGIPLVHYSTEYVFDGEASTPYTEDAARRPLNVYGASKAAGEDAIRANAGEHLIVRTQWLFGDSGRSFPLTMLRLAAARRPTRVVNDQFGRPTYAKDLAEASWELLLHDARGLVHVTNEGQASWWDVALAVFESMDASPFLSPCSTAEYPTPARRPKRAVLDTTRASLLLSHPMRSWQRALDEFLRSSRV